MSRLFFSTSLAEQESGGGARGPTLTVSADISTPTTWSNQDVHITKDIIVSNTLTVEAGTHILFDGVFWLECRKGITINGTPGNRVQVKPSASNAHSQFFGIMCGNDPGVYSNSNPMDAGSVVSVQYADFINGSKIKPGPVSYVNPRGRKRGGAIFALYNYASTFSVSNCTFTDCKAHENGGAIFVQDNNKQVTINIEDCVFTGCQASQGGFYGTQWVGGGFQTSHPKDVNNLRNVFTNCIGGTNWQNVAATVNVGTNTVSTPSNHDLYNGASLVFTQGTPPAPCVLGTRYFVIRTGGQTLKLAATAADAMSNTPITLTTAGTSPKINANQDWNVFDLGSNIVVTTP